MNTNLKNPSATAESYITIDRDGDNLVLRCRVVDIVPAKKRLQEILAESVVSRARREVSENRLNISAMARDYQCNNTNITSLLDRAGFERSISYTVKAPK